MVFRSRLVAASTRAVIGTAWVAPTGRTSFSCKARSSLACRSIGNSPISSKKTVPPSPAESSPSFERLAPVNAPFTWPKSSLSIRVGTSVPQSTAMKGLAAFGPLSWIARATISLPVPLSPRISTGWVECATLESMRYTFSISGELPIRPPSPVCARSRSRSLRLSRSKCCLRLDRPSTLVRLLQRERLGQIVGGPDTHRLHRGSDRGKRRHHHHPGLADIAS